jgi:hypothetical protein
MSYIPSKTYECPVCHGQIASEYRLAGDLERYCFRCASEKKKKRIKELEVEIAKINDGQYRKVDPETLKIIILNHKKQWMP